MPKHEPTNPLLLKTIKALRKASKEGPRIWRALAEELDKSRRRRNAVNLSKINRYTEPGDIVAVPGKVLGAGFLDHPVTVAAFTFSKTALEKIEMAQGRAITLLELLEEGVEPSRIKIIK